MVGLYSGVGGVYLPFCTQRELWVTQLPFTMGRLFHMVGDLCKNADIMAVLMIAY